MQKFARACSRAGEVSPGSLCGRDHAANFLQPFRASETLCQHTALWGAPCVGTEPLKSPRPSTAHAVHRRGQPARRQYESMLASPRSQEEASLCSMRPASAACARVAGNSSTAFRRTCLWKTIAKTRFTRTPRAVRLDISPPRSPATNESPDAARARRAASVVSRFLKPVHR